MPHYFFETDDGDHHVSDHEGTELEDDAAARSLALATLPHMARDKMPDSDRRVFVVTVRDARRNEVYSAELSLTGRWTRRPNGGGAAVGEAAR